MAPIIPSKRTAHTARTMGEEKEMEVLEDEVEEAAAAEDAPVGDESAAVDPGSSAAGDVVASIKQELYMSMVYTEK